MECSCSIYTCSDYEFDDVISQKMITGRAVHKCGECGRDIQPGEQYELYRASFDGEIERYKTCEDCLLFRNNFFDGWCFASLWEDFRNHMDDCGWQVPEDCLAEVTPRTRAEICERIEHAWFMEELDDE